MRLSYKLGNVLGSVYSSGNLEFFPDGNRLVSPVGNKFIIYDLKSGKSNALDIQLEYNVKNVCLSPNGSLLLASTDRTQLYMISLISSTVVQRKDYKRIGDTINDLKFSPDGKYYTVCGAHQVMVYLTPGFVLKGRGRQLSAFKIHKIIKSSFTESSCLSWSLDSKLLLIGSKDFVIKIYPIDRQLKNIGQCITLSGHNDQIVSTFFANCQSTELNIYSISKNGQLFVWQSNYESLEELSKSNEDKGVLRYTKQKNYYINNDLQKTYSNLRLTACEYNKKMKLLVVGYSNGSFLLYDMQDITLIHSLELSNSGSISSIAINSSGDWIAIGSAIGEGNKYDIENELTSESQLIVWEWQSESFILKQSGYSTGVTNLCQSIAYSPDATLIASGGTDGKVKIWNTFSGFCICTFNEHKGPISALEFMPGKNGKVLISASLDGTVKAFDLNRYRNFRTLTTPSDAKAAQFMCLTVDQLGADFIACGSHNLFEIFLWSLQTGRMLECLSGHEAPVSGVKFSPTSNTLVSCSWDRTVRIWDLFEGSKCTREVIRLGSDALALAFRGDGHQFAVSTLNGDINFFDPQSGDQMGVGIEGKRDLGVSHYERELIKDKNKYFSALHYSADGTYVMAAGKSKHICIYHVMEKLLVKKLSITWNLSMDGLFDYISSRKISEFGFNLALIKNRNQENSFAPICLPGVSKSDFSDRSVNPIISVFDIKFSPTMRTFAFASSEGIMMYSLDNENTFDPFQLETDITPSSCRQLLQQNKYCESLMQSLKLNEQKLVEEVIESVPIDDISFICVSLPINYVIKCLHYIAIAVESTKHIEFYLKWSLNLLYNNGTVLKTSTNLETFDPTLRLLQYNLNRHFDNLSKVCEHNKYLMKLIHVLAAHHKPSQKNIIDDDNERHLTDNEEQEEYDYNYKEVANVDTDSE
ncbi:periodic tryptophan protein 2 homolog [Oppia nitens]|uniref:periodic tryptophan protein 2 homolog n=1 Tax=Oppia nitens TaxID=1686743 RepID=UPI0023DA05C4|nr:periodic tryptophan protein 2 homolog [Oppia nitens]